MKTIPFPVDLVAEVPDHAFLDGLRAAFHAHDSAAFCVAEVTDTCGIVVIDAHVTTVDKAREWLASLDWEALATEERGGYPSETDKGDYINHQRGA